jgi:hypothetical protein
MVTFQPLTMYFENLAYGLVTGVSETITGTGWVGVYWAVWMGSPFGAEDSVAFATKLMNADTIAARLAYLAGVPFICRITTSPPSHCEVAVCATTVVSGTLIAQHVPVSTWHPSVLAPL